MRKIINSIGKILDDPLEGKICL